MEWQDWLEKTEPTGLTARQKKLAKEIADGDNEDHKQQFTPTLNPKEASWETWLEKTKNPMGLKGNRGYNTRLYEDTETHHVGIHDNKNDDIHEISGTGSNYIDEIGQDTSPAHSTKPKGTILDPVKRSWESWLEKNDPCWEGYEQYGMKDKEGKKVPNCVKKADESKPLNKPMRDDGSKKFKVFVRDPSTGNIITVRFGDPNMEIKRDNPERRSSFRARHKCSEQKDITSAAYWSCKMWEKTSSVSDNVNKSNWELWLEKNNATETSHKEGEKKEEWNGKFDNSTTRDDAKDEKAESEEESLEELTDGKLEEVEKLKAWEVFLEKNQYPQDNKSEKKDEDGDSEINYETGTKLQESKETGQATLTDDKHRDMENEDTSNNLTERFRKGNLKGQKQGAGRKGYYNAGDSGGVPKGWAGKYGKGGKSFGAEQWGGTMSGDSARPNADGTRTTLEGLRQQIQRINEHENKKELSSTGQPATSHQKEVAEIESVGKSWELFLEKGITYKEQNVGVHKEQPYAKARTAKEIREAAENVKSKIVLDEDMKKSWNEWLEKMQGAGDARFGNQHLTGMEQKPVADDESIELSAESDKNNEKQEKTEDKEDKDNKPYKALSQE